jgi:hypothetical protein
LKKIYKKEEKKGKKGKEHFSKGIYSGEKFHTLEAKNSAFKEMKKKAFWL